MTARDLVATAAHNLWRMKLRTFLTTSGVVIAIGAFVSMLSFGAGNRQYFTDQAEGLGLFQTMQVYPRTGGGADSLPSAELDDAAVARLAELPGVKLAYPFNDFPVIVGVADTLFTTTAQALSVEAVQTRIFSRIVSGTPFSGDDAREVLVTTEFLDMAGLEEPDSAVGLSLVVSARVASIDSAVTSVLMDKDGALTERLAEVRTESLTVQDYRRQILFQELGAAATRFIDGLINARRVVRDTLTISGVLRTEGPHSLRIHPVIIPVAAARRFDSGGLGDDPTDLFAAVNRGALFASPGDGNTGTYSQITLDTDMYASHEVLTDSIEALGFRSFSYAIEFDQIRRFFFYFDLALGAVGFIALITASLGIVNTMVMSVSERRREIGLLKSLGADEREIRLLFLAESAVIGFAGSLLGVLLGWVVARIASFAAQIVMDRQGIPVAELFATPPWLVAIAVLFGVLVSLSAGMWPAARAARVDPVEALRGE